MKRLRVFSIIFSGLLFAGGAILYAAEEAGQKTADVSTKKAAEISVPANLQKKGALGKAFLNEPLKENVKKMDVVVPKRQTAPSQQAEATPIQSWFISPLSPVFRFVTPFSRLPSGWVEMANISDEWSNVIVKVYNREGEHQEGQAFRLPPHGYARTREMFGNRHIPAIADPAVVEVKSLKPLCVTSVRYSGDSQGWGFDVLPVTRLEEEMRIPVHGWDNAMIEFANPWGEDLNLTVGFLVRSESGGLIELRRTITLPPMGYCSSMEAALMGGRAGNLYGRGDPLIVSVNASRPVAVNLARWSDNTGSGTTPSSAPSSATSPFGGAWTNSWIEGVFHDNDTTVETGGGVFVFLYSRSGHRDDISGSFVTTPTSYVNTFDALFAPILTRVNPTAANILVSEPGTSVPSSSISLDSPCAVRTAESYGFALPVIGDSEIEDYEGEIVYEFPVQGFENAAVEIANGSLSDTFVTLEIFNESGTRQGQWRAALPGNGYINTTGEGLWVPDMGPTEPDIYAVARPCVVRVSAVRGHAVKVVNTRWNDWGAVGFAPLPKFMLEKPELPRIESIEPADDVGFVELSE